MSNQQTGRTIRHAFPGQAVRASDFNSLVRQSAVVTVDRGLQPPESGQPQPSIHFLQGNSDFPASGGSFGVDVFLNEAYTIWGYWLTYSGTGTFRVQMTINATGVGPIITESDDLVVTMIDDPKPIYADNKTCGLSVIASSGTITNFALVFGCWRRA